MGVAYICINGERVTDLVGGEITALVKRVMALVGGKE
jgi:hypothetical protein